MPYDTFGRAPNPHALQARMTVGCEHDHVSLRLVRGFTYLLEWLTRCRRNLHLQSCRRSNIFSSPFQTRPLRAEPLVQLFDVLVRFRGDSRWEIFRRPTSAGFLRRTFQQQGPHTAKHLSRDLKNRSAPKSCSPQAVGSRYSFAGKSRRHGQDRTFSMPHHIFGSAAHHDALHTRVTVCGNDDKVDLFFARKVDDGLERFTSGYITGNRHVFKLTVSEPLQFSAGAVRHFFITHRYDNRFHPTDRQSWLNCVKQTDGASKFPGEHSRVS